jgi:thymidine kinase
MKSINYNAGKLEIIIGCMYSSKTSTLISKIRQHKLMNRNVLIVNHRKDIRYNEGEGISSHDNINIEAMSFENLFDIFENENYKIIDTIFIEEAQFFNDLYKFVIRAVEVDNKHIILCGLDGDYQRKPYRQVIDLIPYADIVERKNALCSICRDGTIAAFSKRIIESDERTIIGGVETYMPVCRFHYNN